MKNIKKINALQNYILNFIFTDGSEILFDMKPFLKYGLYSSIRDEINFQQVKFDGDHIYWNKVADIHLNTILQEGIKVPEISRFYGLIISLYFKDTDFHHRPHIHVRYGDNKASFAIDDGELLAGSLPLKQTKLIQTWIILRQNELLEDWELIQEGKDYFTIAPLR